MTSEPIASAQLPIGQFEERAGIIDLAWGHPDPDLVPVEPIRRAAARALERYGPEALAYGSPAGPGPLIEFIRSRVADTDARMPAVDEVLVTGGSSAALDQVATMLADPGDVVLVESPTYHLAIRIFQDHPVRLVSIPTDADGVDPDATLQTIRGIRAAGGRPRLLYTVPTFHNPTGRSLADARRADLVQLAESEGVTIVEDDAYRELTYDGAAPSSLWGMGGAAGVVVRLGTYAKSIAPGLRVGFVTAAPQTIARFVQGGMLDSGGGANPFVGLVVAEYADAGDYARHVDLLRAAYRERRDGMLRSLAASMPRETRWTTPAGGYFVWVTLPPGLDAARLLPLAEQAGMSFVPGTTFHVDGAGGSDSLRMAFSRYPPALIEEAISRLAKAIRAAA